MALVFFLARNFIGNILFGIRGLILPNATSEIALQSNAYESNISALETENNELKKLLLNAGVKIPSSGEMIDTQTTDTGSATTTATSTDENTISIVNGVVHTSATTSRPIKLQEGDVVATVLIRPPQSPYDILTIDSGTDEGVLVGDQVYAWSGFPLGEVIDTEKSRSIVKLFSAPGNKIEVFIGTSTTAVQAEGRGGGNFFLKLPKVSNIKNGDLVARRFLPPEVFSSIESVDSNAGEAYTYAYFKLPINLNNLVYVLVKKNNR